MTDTGEAKPRQEEGEIDSPRPTTANTDMEWEDTIADIRSLYTGLSNEGDTSGTTPQVPPSHSQAEPKDSTTDPAVSPQTGNSSHLQERVKAYLADKTNKAIESAKGNLGPMRLTYETNKKAWLANLLTTMLSGAGQHTAVDHHDLYTGGDGRSGRAIMRCTLQNNESASFSFNPDNWTCNICVERPNHRMAAREVLVLSDQAFPAILPSCGSKECIKIIRIEFGTLAELTNMLIKIAKGRLPTHSLVCLWSASHLAEVGTASYATNLCNEARRIRAIFGTTLKIAAAPPVMVHGTDHPNLTRSILELEAWLQHLPREEHPLPTAWRAAVRTILDSAEGTEAPTPLQRFQLPTSLYLQGQQKTVSSGNWATIRERVPALGEAEERTILAAMANDIRDNLAIEIDDQPVTSRAPIHGVAERARNYLLIGNSMTAGVAEQLSAPGCNVTKIWEPVWKLTDKGIEKTVKMIRAVKQQLSYATIVVQPLDAIAFRARSTEGSTSAIEDGHVRGSLVVTSKERVEDALKSIFPILDQTREVNTIIITPLPQYVGSPCCSDPTHLTNRQDIDFYSTIKEGLEHIRLITHNYLQHHGYTNARVLDPMISIKGHPIKDIWIDNNISALTHRLVANSVKKIELTAAGAVKRKAVDHSASEPKRGSSTPSPSYNSRGGGAYRPRHLSHNEQEADTGNRYNHREGGGWRRGPQNRGSFYNRGPRHHGGYY